MALIHKPDESATAWRKSRRAFSAIGSSAKLHLTRRNAVSSAAARLLTADHIVVRVRAHCSQNGSSVELSSRTRLSETRGWAAGDLTDEHGFGEGWVAMASRGLPLSISTSASQIPRRLQRLQQMPDGDLNTSARTVCRGPPFAATPACQACDYAMAEQAASGLHT